MDGVYGKKLRPVVRWMVVCALIITLYEVQHVLNVTTFPTMSFRINGTQQFAQSEGKTQLAHKFSKMVLILTYMRSGSSLTGDILQQSSGAFYVYEPLRGIAARNRSNFPISYINGTMRRPPFSIKREYVDVLYNWFTCNTSQLPVVGVFDNFLNRGIKTQAMRPCLKEVYNATKSEEKAINVCIKQLEERCTDSPVRIVKTIRMPVSDIKHLLEELPTLHIVHLVRDPRATLFSQAHFGMCKQGGQRGCTNRYCERLENDVIELDNLKLKYSDRIMNVLYEDIAKDPLAMSRKMYDFIGEDFTRHAETYIYNITMAGNKNNCAICTTRSNSSVHIDSWKRKMKPEFIHIVNDRCKYILKRFNFDDFPDT